MRNYAYQIVFNDKQTVCVLKLCKELPGRILKQIAEQIAGCDLFDITETFGDAKYTEYKFVWSNSEYDRLYMLHVTQSERPLY